MTMRFFRLPHLLLAALLAMASWCVQAEAQADYPLSAGDAIRVQVFQNPDLTIETRVSESGSITYPLIGAVELGGLSIAAAEKKIADALQKGGFIRQPQVNIVLVQIRGNQVSVLGQVSYIAAMVMLLVLTRLQSFDAGLEEGDQVSFLPPLSGG